MPKVDTMIDGEGRRTGDGNGFHQVITRTEVFILADGPGGGVNQIGA